MKYLILVTLSVLLTSTHAYATGPLIFGGNHSSSNANALGVGVGIGGGGYGAGGTGGGAFINQNNRIASMAYAPPAYPTATCLKAYSGGGSGVGFGFSLGTTVVDYECRKFEAVRTLVNLKRNHVLPDDIDTMILDVACETESIATSDKCVAHNAKREGAKNPQTDTTVAKADDPFQPERKVKIEDWFK